ncbi:MAG TPA: right-handed parallel beta-helix repeat-containing protein [Acidobacteriaceae bacterium]|nr:right-handed parallel beta-helix repeat-containing protein [Acidobacteriaceae bacterium]
MKGYRLFAAAVGLAASCSMTCAAKTLCVNPNGTGGCYKTIGAAVAAASAGDIVQVQEGTYYEEVTITKTLSLVAAPGAHPVIDAMNLPHGIWVNGMSAAPKPGVAGVVISGLKVRHANFEGILLSNVTDATLEGNEVTENDQSLDGANGTCPGLPTTFETNEQGDCGEGIHLMAVDHSTILRNEVAHNAGGILITDETGPNAHNLISENFVHDNVYDCGITLASHGAAKAVIPTATLPYGVWYNTISRNISLRNGTQSPGAGVGIFAPGPGNTDTGNVVINNVIRDNGATGVAMHNHAAPPTAPPVNLNDNAIVGNFFSGNGPDNPGAPTTGPTGINVFSVAPITGTTISQNTFENEAIDVGFSAVTGNLTVHFNNFSRGVGVENLKTGTVDATENWWHCPFGPGMGHACATATGTVWTAPWLTTPFDADSDAHSDSD